MEARELEAERLLALAKFYLRPAHDRQDAARGYLQDVTAGFPETKAAAEAERLLSGLSAEGTKPQPAVPAPTSQQTIPAAQATVPQAVVSAPAPKSVKKSKLVKVQPATATQEDAEPLQSGEGRFLRPIENLEDYRK